MRVPTRPQQGISFNITPLIDIVFLLVIFFLVASHFARSEPTEEVDLPTAEQTTDDEFPRRLTITIQPDGTSFVSAQQISLTEIEVLIAEGANEHGTEYAVRIRGDRQVPFRYVEPIMLACAKNGITKFGFHVIERE